MTHRNEDDIRRLFSLVNGLKHIGDYEARKENIANRLSGDDTWISNACFSIVEDCRRDENRHEFNALANRMAEGFIELRNAESNEEINQILPKLEEYLGSAATKSRSWTNAPTKRPTIADIIRNCFSLFRSSR